MLASAHVALRRMTTFSCLVRAFEAVSAQMNFLLVEELFSFFSRGKFSETEALGCLMVGFGTDAAFSWFRVFLGLTCESAGDGCRLLRAFVLFFFFLLFFGFLICLSVRDGSLLEHLLQIEL